jgi:hypothetical protein
MRTKAERHRRSRLPQRRLLVCQTWRFTPPQSSRACPETRMFLHGKMNYVAPVYPMMFAAGAVWIEGATGRRLWIWVKPALALAMTTVCGIYVRQSCPSSASPASSPTNARWASSNRNSSTCSREYSRSSTPTCSAGRVSRSVWPPTITRSRPRSSARPPSSGITMVTPEPSTSSVQSTSPQSHRGAPELLDLGTA